MKFRKSFMSLFMFMLLFVFVGCGSDNDGGNFIDEKDKILGYVVDDPIKGANITIYKEDGKSILLSTKTKEDGSFSVIKPESNNTSFYILSATGGTIKGKTFEGTMSVICLIDDIKSCNITPYTTMLTQLVGQYNGTVITRLNKASTDIKNLLGVDHDPFMKEHKGGSVSDVNLALWRDALASGLGLSSMIQSVQSDMNDGYIDNSSLKKIFTKAKLRTEKAVTESDFVIDKTVETPIEKDDNDSLEHLSLPTDTVVTREIYSMSQGTKGSGVTSKGYLSDIAYVETQDYSKVSGDVNDSIERIIYQSFNVGKWSGKLNAETTILGKIFMAEPTLLFLPNSEKERVSEILVQDDSFLQAKNEYFKIIKYSVDASQELLNNLITNLGNIGKEKLENSQIINSSSILTSKLNKINFKQNRKIVTSTSLFQAFDGMWLSYDKDKLKVHSRSSLWYGLQSEANFKQENDFFKSWSTTSLITPKVGLVSKEDVTYVKDEVKYGAVTSEIDLIDIKNNSVSAMLYRNNPNNYIDAPQVMNTISIAQILLETVGVSSRLFNNSKIMKAIEKTYEASLLVQKKYEDVAKIFFALADIGLTVGELTCDKKDTLCQQNLKNIHTFATQIDNLFNFSQSTSSVEDSLSKAKYKNKALEVMKSFRYAITGKKHKIKNSLGLLKPILLAKLIIQPSSKFAGDEMSDFDSYILARSLFTPDTTNKKYLKSKTKFLSIWSKAISKGFNAKKLLFSIKTTQSTFKGIVTLKNIKDDFSKIDITELTSEILKSLLEGSSSFAIEQIYSIVKNITPAKFLDFAIAGNKLGAIGYDWLTDPTLVKLTMKKSGKNLDIEHAIPEFKAIRYLKIPENNTKLIDMKIPRGYVAGQTVFTKGNSLTMTLGIGELDNHFLVMSGFKASVENQSAYKEIDNGNVKALLKNKNINMLWHVKKFDKASTFRKVLLKDRTESTAFNTNYIKAPLSDTFWWFTDAIIDADEDNIRHSSPLQP